MASLLRPVVRPVLNRLADLIEWLLPGWNPDAAWRYLPMARTVAAVVGPRARVLDVGAGDTGIAPYVRNPCVLADSGTPTRARAPFVQANCLRLPFRDRAFPAVVSADLLEHLPAAERPAAVAEMLRVAERLVVIAAPTGPAAEAHDRRLHECSAEAGRSGFLAEHLAHGLPSAEDLVGWVATAAHERFGNPEVRVRQNASLAVRYAMMRGIVGGDEWGAIIRVRLWTPLSPLLARLNMGRCYRTIVSCSDTRVDPS